jgi:hypothetical protein
VFSADAGEISGDKWIVRGPGFRHHRFRSLSQEVGRTDPGVIMQRDLFGFGK